MRYPPPLAFDLWHWLLIKLQLLHEFLYVKGFFKIFLEPLAITIFLTAILAFIWFHFSARKWERTDRIAKVRVLGHLSIISHDWFLEGSRTSCALTFLYQIVRLTKVVRRVVVQEAEIENISYISYFNPHFPSWDTATISWVKSSISIPST